MHHKKKLVNLIQQEYIIDKLQLVSQIIIKLVQ